MLPSSRYAKVLILAALFCVLGCSKDYIPNTDLEDTKDNRRIVEFCEQYRRAVELRNVPLLLKFADARYYEDGGNMDSSDDLDRAGLAEHLQTKFREATAVRYEIRYRRVSKGRKGEVFVDYTYSASYKIPTGAGESWRHTVADNRLELSPHGETFTILAGM
ncbi:MAG TPA: hypothetical protein VL137_02550 [Polyangiaceae bacterium]|jgi:hypothetical protein|nr:hypothetical protein [Polyangiaceae bacterium]